MKSGIWKTFLALCSSSSDMEKLDEFFELIFTKEEHETIEKRLIVIRNLLDEKITQREISRQYKVSISSITRGSNALKIVSDELKESLKKTLLAKDVKC
ncbi:trp operon repressor [Candidatus Aerophobetes bacterium]|uniref:Trp operon repressor homolog n=1 Tax=Aerophobetes bacterium TaxID=2030807 RepID=A0A2A4YM10_UNCAE|nr:MAG: trp operon repressor [Candidatus Aerophobetes bacterium]